MSVTDRVKLASPDAPAWPRRTWRNLAQTLALFVRPPRTRQRPLWRAPAGVAAGAALAVIAIAVLMMTVDAGTVALASHLPPWLRSVAAEVTGFGKSGWFLFPIAAVLVLIALRSSVPLSRTNQLVLLSVTLRLSFLFAAIGLPSLFTTIVKRLIGRARPYVDALGDPFHYQPLVWRVDFASMPSGHATTAVAAAVAIGLIWPRLRIPLCLYALVILASRVLLTAHYPSDVLAATFVGAAGAYLVRDWFAARRLGFVIGPDGRVRTLPGPSFGRIKRVARRLLAP